MLLHKALIGLLAVHLPALVALGAESSPNQAEAFEPQAAARPWKSIVLHHSATSGGSVEAIDAAHRRRLDAAGRPWRGIGYHFVVGNGHSMPDGEIQPTFRWRQQLAGAHAGGREANETGIGICLIGNFEETAPTEKQLAALGRLLKTLSARYAISRERVVRHNDVQETLCPGALFPWKQVLAEVPAAGGT